MKVTYYVEVATRGANGVNLSLENQRIPFIPIKGMMLCVLTDDDSRRIDEVYWDAGEPRKLLVFFETEENPMSTRMRRVGWKDAD